MEEFSPFNSDGEINLVSSEIFLKAYLTNSLDTTSILSAPYNIGAKLYYSLLKQTFNVDLLLSI
ncbi:MAG: hypothetical protein JJE21_03910 [Spirochaetaceae bacterium]|nr:hypothetical protein [Spirochaetaceae bacterium]